MYHRSDVNAAESAKRIEELGREALVCNADVGYVHAYADVVEKTFELSIELTYWHVTQGIRANSTTRDDNSRGVVQNAWH